MRGMKSSTCPHCGTTISDPTLEECQFCRRQLTGSVSPRASLETGVDDRAFNPFQAPQSEIDDSDVITDDLIVRVEGDQLVVQSGAVLPPFCVKTNEPVEPSRMWKKTLIWSPQYLGLLILILADVTLALSGSVAVTLAGIALWGLHLGFTQGLLATLVAEETPADMKGTAFGLFNLVSGLCLLLASVLAGWMWDRHGSASTFVAGGALAATALAATLWWHCRERRLAGQAS
jgi:hypothetical protein